MISDPCAVPKLYDVPFYVQHNSNNFKKSSSDKVCQVINRLKKYNKGIPCAFYFVFQPSQRHETTVLYEEQTDIQVIIQIFPSSPSSLVIRHVSNVV